MPTQIQLRRDTAADWTSNNPTMAAGEFGWESDTNRFKIGDGSNAWNSLAYADTLKTLGDIAVTGSTISAPSNGDLTLTTSGSGKINISNAYTLPSSDGSANQVLQTNGAGVLSFGTVSVGDFTFVGSTISSPSNADITLTPGGTGGVVASALRINGTTISSDDSATININDGLNVDGTANVEGALTTNTSLGLASGATVTSILDEDNLGSDSATALATQQSIKAYVDNEVANVSVGDLTFTGSTIAAPSNADLTLNSSNGNVVIEGIRVAGTTISTEDSSPGVEIAGNLIPSQDGVFQLGSSSKRWQTLFVAAETIDLGGATISSDGSGSLTIAATGATLPSGSKVVDQAIVLGGKTNKTTQRPVQIVKVFVSDGSTSFTDAQLLAKTADLELEFNGTVEDVPVYTEANQTFTLTNGDSLQTNAGGVTLFQF
jgi:hypothetical protein|tara:strand:- start:3477 stop:4775 length:1299 start_codon:yes stop_codon:yes gene_type:complete